MWVGKQEVKYHDRWKVLKQCWEGQSLLWYSLFFCWICYLTSIHLIHWSIVWVKIEYTILIYTNSIPIIGEITPTKPTKSAVPQHTPGLCCRRPMQPAFCSQRQSWNPMAETTRLQWMLCNTIWYSTHVYSIYIYVYIYVKLCKHYTYVRRYAHRSTYCIRISIHQCMKTRKIDKQLQRFCLCQPAVLWVW